MKPPTTPEEAQQLFAEVLHKLHPDVSPRSLAEEAANRLANRKPHTPQRQINEMAEAMQAVLDERINAAAKMAATIHAAGLMRLHARMLDEDTERRRNDGGASLN